MTEKRIAEIQLQLHELTGELGRLLKKSRGIEVPLYRFESAAGEVSLLDLFAGKDTLLAIPTWARVAVTARSGPTDSTACFRIWSPRCRWCCCRRIRPTYSGGSPMHAVGASVWLRMAAAPTFASRLWWPDRTTTRGAVVYKREGDRILCFNACVFGPGDIYCSLWSLLALAGLGAEDWTPQFSYWRRPDVLDGGGDDVVD